MLCFRHIQAGHCLIVHFPVVGWKYGATGKNPFVNNNRLPGPIVYAACRRLQARRHCGFQPWVCLVGHSGSADDPDGHPFLARRMDMLDRMGRVVPPPPPAMVWWGWGAWG